MIRIARSRLQVAIDDPDGSQRIPRWSRAGFIRQVVLDGRHAFCGRGDPRGTGGAGLCQEFNLTLPPPGFAVCGPDGWFVKPGVDLVRRSDGECYHFLRPYSWVPAWTQVDATADRVRFAIEHPLLPGVGLALTQEPRLDGAALIARGSAVNRGDAPLALEEYRHDFLSPGGLGPGGGRRLHVDRPLRPRGGSVISRLAEDGALAVVPPPPGRNTAWTGVEAPAPATWRLEDPRTGLALTMASDRSWGRFALFTSASQFSPEAFLYIDLPPGASATWSRTWTFGAPA